MNKELDKQTNQLKEIIDNSLFLNCRTKLWANHTRLFNNIPELDALSVMNVIVAIENNFDILMEYDDFNAEVFETVQSLSVFIYQKILINKLAIAI